MKAKEKEIQRTLLGIAVELPVNYTSTSLVENISGKRLLEKDPEYTQMDGSEIEPDKIYRRSYESYAPVNHFKRMLRIYRKKGMEGIKLYIKEVYDLEIEAKKVTNIGGIAIECD